MGRVFEHVRQSSFVCRPIALVCGDEVKRGGRVGLRPAPHWEVNRTMLCHRSVTMQRHGARNVRARQLHCSNFVRHFILTKLPDTLRIWGILLVPQQRTSMSRGVRGRMTRVASPLLGNIVCL